MDLKFIISLTIFSLLLKTVASEVIAYAHASSHVGSSGSKHQQNGRLNLTERMEELKAHIKTMREKHLQHRIEMFNKHHKHSGQENHNRQHHKPSNPHKEVSEFHVVEPVTTQATSTYLVNSIQTKEPVTEQLISTSTEQIFYSPEVDKSYNIVEKPKEISTTSTIISTEESTMPTVTVTVTEKSTITVPTISITKEEREFTPTVTVTEESTVANIVGSIPLPESTEGEISESTASPIADFTNTYPEEETAAHDFSNLSVSPENSNEDSSYDNFDIDIRDGEIGA